MTRDLLVSVALNVLAPLFLVGVLLGFWWLVLGFVGPFKRRRG